MQSLTCASSPNRSLTKTNKVYVSEADFVKPVSLRIGSCVFVAEPNRNVDRGNIALNKAQRQTLEVEVLDEVDCFPFDSSMSFELGELVLAYTEHLVNVDQMAQQVKHQLEGQLLCVKQQLIVDHEGRLIIVSVESMKLGDEDVMAFGKITSDTRVTIE